MAMSSALSLQDRSKRWSEGIAKEHPWKKSHWMTGGGGDVDTAERFGYQWHRYRQLFPHYRRQFEGWIHPFPVDSFAGKDVLDAGCGMGRNTFWTAKLGARRIDAFDASELAMTSAREFLAPLPNVRVEKLNIYDLDRPKSYDICFSLGVIHHLSNPHNALQRLVEALRPGGSLIVWLYGYEGNERYAKAFRKIHPVLRRVNPRIIHAFAHGVTAPLYSFLRLPLRKSLYMQELSQFPYWHTHLIVVDQLIPDVVHFYRRSEVKELFSNLNVRHVTIHHNRGYSWTVIAKK